MADELDLTSREKLMLKELSLNSRTSQARLAQIARCSPMKANRLLGRLIDRLGIRFTVEFDMSKLGLEERHVVLIKFGKKPSEAFLSKFFENDPYAHDVYMAKGDFDLFIFAAADTPNNYIRWETELAANLSEYLPELRPSSYVQTHLGYMPLNGSFANFTKERTGIDSKDRRILQALNTNSRSSYRDMSKQLGINEDTIRYRVFRLLRRGVIRRFTIAAQIKGGCLTAFFARYRFDTRTLSDIFPAIRRHDMSEIEEMPAINSTPMVTILSGSYRWFALTFGKTREEALNFGVRWYSKLLKDNNPHIAYAVILKPVKGLLPLRNLDAKRYYSYAWNVAWT